jgi:hypothetical protein
VLSSILCDLYQVEKALLTLLEACDDGFLGKLREVFVLDDEVMQVVSQVVCTGSSSVAVENSKEADLGPFDI